MNHSGSQLKEIINAVRSYLDFEKECGVEEVFLKGVSRIKPLDKNATSSLAALRQEVVGCKNCDLCDTRRNVVFGSGNPKARLMFIGEAPGEEEDLQGLPFVGRAGGLLTKIIEAMGMKRQDVYIANILKCRPPGNRMPLPTEILACRDNLKRQIQIINPRVICTLGKFASQALLKTETPITALRGRFHTYDGIQVMPTFHPAYLLRNPQEKKLVWWDMKKIMRELAGP